MTPRNGCVYPGRRLATIYTRNSIWCIRDIAHAVSDMSNPRKVTGYDTDQKAPAPYRRVHFTTTRFTIHDSKPTKGKIVMTAVAGASPTAGFDR